MQSGKLQHVLTIERPRRPQDDRGNILETWEPVPGFRRIFGEVLPDRASEFFAGRQIQSSTNALIRIYDQPGIEPTMRVVHHVRPGVDNYWDIQGVVPFQSRQVELRLMCLKREAQGYRRGIDLENEEALPAPDLTITSDSTDITSDTTTETADAT